MPPARLDPATDRRVRRPPSLIELPIGVMNAATDTDAPPAATPRWCVLWRRCWAVCSSPSRSRRGVSGRWPSSAWSCSSLAQGAAPDAPPGGAARVRVRICRGWRSACAGCGSSPCPATSSRRSLFAGFHAAAAAVAPTGPWRTIGRPAAHTLVEAIRLGCSRSAACRWRRSASPRPAARCSAWRAIGGVILITWIVFQVGCALAGPCAGDPRTLPRAVSVGQDRPTRPGRRRPAARRAGAAGDRVVIVVAAVAPEGHDLDRRAAHDRRRAGRRRAGHLGARRAELPGHRRRCSTATATIEPDPRPRPRRVAGERHRRRRRAVRRQRRPPRGGGRGGPARRARSRSASPRIPSSPAHPQQGRLRQRPGRRHARRRGDEPLREGAHRAVRRVRAVPRAARGARRAARRGAERRHRRPAIRPSTSCRTAPGSG